MFKNLFLHSEENNYYPYALRLPALSAYILFLFIFNIVAIKFFIVSPSQIAAQDAIDINQLYALTNQDRQQNSLVALNVNQQLVNAAEAHGEDMFQEQYWGHYSPSGKSPWDFITASGYQYSNAGENLAKNFTDSASINTAWMNSPEHEANIMDSHYTDIGIALVSGMLQGSEQTIVVQMFASPAASAQPIPAPTVNNPPTPQVKAVSGNYSTVLSTNSKGSYSGVLALPESVQDNNVVKLVATNGSVNNVNITGQPEGNTNTYTITLKSTPQNGKETTSIAQLPLQSKGGKSSSNIQPDLLSRINIFSIMGTHISLLSFQEQINLLFITILTVLIGIDAYAFYRMELRYHRKANPLFHLPLMFSVLILILFVNKGVII